MLKIKSTSFVYYQHTQNTKLTHKITKILRIYCASMKVKQLEAD